MNTQLSRSFFEVVQASVKNFTDIKTFITTETFLRGKLFSFEDHEYQEYVVSHVQSRPGCEAIIVKPSQIGLSEVWYRYFLAKMAVNPGTALLLSFPSKLASSETFKTRFSPIIETSPRLSSMMCNDVDSASVKRMTNESIAYALAGSSNSKSSLISRFISCCLVDEVDRQDPQIYNSFPSRMVHAAEKDKLTVKISTPTIEGFGIMAELEECREVHKPYIVCEHCLNQFYPDYYEHVKLPGWEKSLKALTRTDLARLNAYASYLECPECKGKVERRDYVWKVEFFDTGVYNKVGFVLNPFIARFIRICDLVIDSVKFDSIAEFTQQRLGLPYTEKSSQITRESIRFERSDRRVGRYVLGIDMGKTAHLIEAVLRDDTSLHVLKYHQVMLHEFKPFLKELASRTTFSAMVMDQSPYHELVYSLVQEYPRLFSAIYTDYNEASLYKINMFDKNSQLVRQLSLNKTLMFDNLAAALPYLITFEPSEWDETIVTHMTSMKRVKDYDDQAEDRVKYKWVKAGSKADDHAHHGLLYCWAAAKISMGDLFYAPPLDFSIRKINPTALNARQQHANRLR